MTDMTPARASLDPIEIASRDEIAALQQSRMAWSLRHAYEHSPFYRKRFDDHGVHPDDFRTLADLAKFPFTTKQDLRDTYPFGMFAVPREKLARIHGSSGTTGKPTVVGYTARDIDIWADCMARSIRASVRPEAAAIDTTSPAPSASCDGGRAKRRVSRATRASDSQRSATMRPSARVRVRASSVSATAWVRSSGSTASSATTA